MPTARASSIACVLVALAGCAMSDSDPDLASTESALVLPAPANLTVVNVSGAFTTRQDLSWDAVAGAASYIIYRGTAGPGSETTYTSCCSSGPPFVANHLDENTSYCWEVAAVSSTGQRSARSNEVCLTSLGAQTVLPPATVTATATSASTVRVSWTAVTGATSYRINRSDAGGAFNLIKTTTSTSLLDIGLTENTDYCYTVQTVAPPGTSVPSSPPACTTTVLNGLEGYYRLDEAVGMTTAADSSGFNRNATLSAGAAFSITPPRAPIDSPTGSAGAHLDTGTTGVATTPVVSAFRLGGAFSLSLWAYLPAAATDVRLVGMRNAGVCTTGGGWELSQNVAGLAFRGQAGTVSFGTSLPVGQWTQIAVTFPGTAGGTMNLYLNGLPVASGPYTAQNSLTTVAIGIGHYGGCAGAQVMLDELRVFSRELTATEVGVLGIRPPPPTGLMFTKNTSTSQGLAWTSPAGDVDRWIILRGLSGSGSEVGYTHAPFPPQQNPPPTFNASHLDPSTLYAWQVEAVDNHLISDRSNEVLATTLDPPAAPTGLAATAGSSTRINLSWNAVPNTTRYFIQMSSGGPFAAIGSSTTTTFSAVNLAPNTTYTFQVQAEDTGFLFSPFSAPASATTLP